MKEKTINVTNYLTSSKLPSTDYVINPYVGCPHSCKYCYASFMKRFTNHKEPWGEFIDIKKCDNKIDLKKIKGKVVFLSSVTDCYNPYEEKHMITRGILEQLEASDCILNISTKSNLILRDVDLLKKFKNITVSISINTLDENFKNDMDQASSIKERIRTLKVLHENGIKTILFMSPIFPYITDFKEIIKKTKNYVDEYWFENLNLRGDYKQEIMRYIEAKYPKIFAKYQEIYLNNDMTYWHDLLEEIQKYCDKNKIKYTEYFYHEEKVKNKV